MLTQEKFILSIDDKLSNWGYGEWCEEVDYVYFEYKDHPCIVKRIFVEDNTQYFGGYLCGYVITEGKYPNWSIDDIPNFNVHMGITYTGFNRNFDKVCIGFDCAHFNDIIPCMQKVYKELRLLSYHIDKNSVITSSYKNIEFVKKELISLVDQLIEWSEKENLVRE